MPLVLFHVSACGKGDDADASAADAPIERPLPRLGEIRIVDLTPEAIRPAAVPRLIDGLVKSALDKELPRAEGDPGACRAAIGVGYALLVNRQPVLSADAGEAHALFEGELFCPANAGSPSDVDAYRVKLEARRDFGAAAGGTSDERLLEALRAVIADGTASLHGQARMRHAPDAEIGATLATSDHPGMLAEAASEAGERGLADVAPDLVRLTAHANARVATRAGAALGLLKVATPEVVRALAKMTDGADPEKHLIAIHALADLGTPDAKRYLESLALGHPSPAMRELARERLRGLGTVLTPEREREPEPEPVPEPY